MMEALRHRDRLALGFLPFAAFGEYCKKRRGLVVTRNDDPVGYVLYGSDRFNVCHILYTVVRADARRRENATALVMGVQERTDAPELSLRCAEDLEANAFWESIGFTETGSVIGGRKNRGRRLRVWQRLQHGSLFVPEPPQLVL